MARLGRALTGFIWTRGPIALGQSWTTFQGAAVLGVTAALTAAGIDIQPVAPAPTMSGTFALSADAGGIPQGAVAMSVSASLSTAATVIKPSAVAMTATASMSTAAIPLAVSAASLAATVSMSTTAIEAQFVTVAMAATISMTVSQATSLAASASLAGTVTLVAGAAQGFAVTVLMTPSGNMTVAAVRTPQGVVPMALAATLVAGAGRLVPALATLEADFGLTLGIVTVFPQALSLSVAASLTALAGQTVLTGAVLRPSFSVTITAFTPSSSVRMSVVSSLVAIATAGLAIANGQNYYLRQRQNWAIEQEQQRHAQALYTVGEMACFVLMWHEIDFLRGLVQRCSTCYQTSDPLINRITQVYNQPTRNKCPDCFGTTFEGGFRARIVRPVIITDTDETEKPDRRGMVHTDDMQVETTWDFRSRNGDYLLRADGSRWRLSAPQRTTLRTGFAHPSQLGTAIAYSALRASYEEEGTVAYLLPPTDAGQLEAVLTTPATTPPNFAAFEILRGDLVPAALQD
jgi:hypothetical protein